MLHNKTEKLIYEFILAGALDDAVVNALVPDGKPYDFKSLVFDYKAGYHLSKEPKSPDLELAELIKDFVAFYNSLGGYILVTYPADKSEPPVVTLLNDNDDLLRRLAAYAGAAISVRIFRSKINIGEIVHKSLCIFVPKRPPRSKPVAFAKTARIKVTRKRQHSFLKRMIFTSAVNSSVS